MSKSILFSYRVPASEFTRADDQLTISTPFERKDLISDLVERLEKIGYHLADTNALRFINKENHLHIEGVAFEVVEKTPVGFMAR